MTADADQRCAHTADADQRWAHTADADQRCAHTADADQWNLWAQRILVVISQKIADHNLRLICLFRV